MGQKLTFEQISFIEKQFKSGSSAKEIIQLSGLGLRVVRKYISILKKMAMPFPSAAVLLLVVVGLLTILLRTRHWPKKSYIQDEVPKQF
jgi:hypothetical protein